jgi:hypothetical protein
MATDVKTAVELAGKYLSDLLQIPVQNMLLEEVERSGSYWRITLSYPDPSPSFRTLVGGRTYKIVELDAETGEFVAIKIRNVAYDRSA